MKFSAFTSQNRRIMEAELIEEKTIPKGAFNGLTMTKEDFLTWRPDDEPFVYEFNDGIIESKPGMKQNETKIIRNIEDKFYETTAFRQKSRLFTEVDCWVTERQMRRPDMALYSNEQIERMDEGGREMPAFVIEIISEYDEFGQMNTKLREYFAAGVQVIWWVVPGFDMVHVFTSPKAITIATDTDPLSAVPALTDFNATVEDIFGR